MELWQLDATDLAQLIRPRLRALGSAQVHGAHVTGHVGQRRDRLDAAITGGDPGAVGSKGADDVRPQAATGPGDRDAPPLQRAAHAATAAAVEGRRSSTGASFCFSEL